MIKLETMCFVILTCLIVPTAPGALNYYDDAVLDDSFPGGGVYVWNDAAMTIDGASLSSLDLFNFSSADMQAGTISQGVSIWNQGSMSISGGQVGLFLEFHDAASVDLRGGDVTGWLYAEGTSVVRLFADNVEYHPYAGQWNGGQVTGCWLDDGLAFTINLLDNLDSGIITYDHIVVLPEPGTLFLLGLGGLLLKRRR